MMALMKQWLAVFSSGQCSVKTKKSSYCPLCELTLTVYNIYFTFNPYRYL